MSNELEVRCQQRADAMADSIRTHLVTYNTGGIAALLATATSLVENKIPPDWVIVPVFLFSLGLVVVLISLFLQKGKSLERARNIRQREEVASFDAWFKRNETYDLLAGALFLAGVICGLDAVGKLAVVAGANG